MKKSIDMFRWRRPAESGCFIPLEGKASPDEYIDAFFVTLSHIGLRHLLCSKDLVEINSSLVHISKLRRRTVLNDSEHTDEGGDVIEAGTESNLGNIHIRVD